VVAPLEAHALIEFVNRMVTGVVSILVIVAVLAALLRRPKRRDLVWLAVGLVLGVIGQIILGGMVVLFDLYPPLVMGHFVVSMILVADAVVLHHRAGWPDDDESAPTANPRPAPAVRASADLRRLASGIIAWSALTLFLGTIVTGAGPHAGSHEGQLVDRLPLEVREMARIHGVSVFVLIALTLLTIWRTYQERVPAEVRSRGAVLLTVMAAQGAVGYIQYFSDVPAFLVAIHIGGATAVWVAALRFRLSFTAPRVPAEIVLDSTGSQPAGRFQRRLERQSR
jgi:cytochrome c oxidase assembly protein subunit 15